MRDRLAKLLSVKSLMTLALTATFIYLAAVGVVPGDKFFEIYLMVATFYFGTQATKL